MSLVCIFNHILFFGVSLIMVFIFSTHSEYIVTSTSASYLPEIYSKGKLNKHPNFPLASELPVDGVNLSLIVPAYNEEKRIETMLSNTIPYINSLKIKYEIIIINDGSRDNTYNFVKKLADNTFTETDIKIVNYAKNGGKGFAVKTGMKFAKGEFILMLDADGATEIQEYQKLKSQLDLIANDKGGFVVGSRSVEEEDESNTNVKRFLLRKIFGIINNLFVKVLIGIDYIKDTQCGFKLFTRKSAREIFFNLKLNRWAFDVEIFYLAKVKGIPVKELKVNWKEIGGSKLSLIPASTSFIKDYFAIVTFYNVGFWKIN